MEPESPEELLRLRARRDFIRRAAAGTVVAVLGGMYFLDDRATRIAAAQTGPAGRPRLPPGQRVISALRPMGGEEGSPRLEDFQLSVHGEVDRPFTLSYAQLLAEPQVDVTTDVHCVTGWSVLGATFRGVRIAHLAERAGVRANVRHVIFEAAHGYTTNVPYREAIRNPNLVTHTLDGRPLPRTHGGPARGLVPHLYFWKSAKWITGIRFVRNDAPGYWETRGYHNHADPWREERYG